MGPTIPRYGINEEKKVQGVWAIRMCGAVHYQTVGCVHVNVRWAGKVVGHVVTRAGQGVGREESMNTVPNGPRTNVWVNVSAIVGAGQVCGNELVNKGKGEWAM